MHLARVGSGARSSVSVGITANVACGNRVGSRGTLLGDNGTVVGLSSGSWNVGVGAVVTALQLEGLVGDRSEAKEVVDEEDRLGDHVENTVEDHLGVRGDDVTC